MRLFQPFKEEYQSYYGHGRPILVWAGIVGAVAFPLFYMLQLVRATHEYDNVWLREAGALLCLALALRARWPERLRPYYLAWSYVAFVYCMPFFFIFMSLKNGGGSIGVANTFMAIFFLILLTDWRNTLVMLFLGAGLAAAAYILTTDNPGMPRDYIGRWPPFVLVVIGGSMLKFSQRQIQAERLEWLTALAGSIAHEMRHPLGQVQQSLRTIGDLLPAPLASTLSHTLPLQTLENLYQQLASGEQAVRRGLQVVSMTLDEVNARPPQSASFSPMSAAEVTERALREFGYDHDGLRDRVRLQVPEDFTFRGDETAYCFVLFNLLKNALYYVPTHPDMTLTITVQADHVSVRDTGPGIPAEVLATLFEPFRSVGKSGGTGLGLAYCSRVMHAFGGQIECDSVLGEYTQFTLRFPPVGEQEIEAYRDSVLARAKVAFVGKRLLVVEDDAAQRVTTRHKLRPLDAAVDEAADGQRALELLARNSYDLVLLDLRMPVLNGYEVAKRIRQGQVPANRDVRIVAYTSEPAYLASVKTQNAGMDSFVAKPCAQLPLLQALVHALHRTSHTQIGSTLAGLRVILADDSPYNRKAIAAYLRNAGSTVIEADHGSSVLEQLQSQDPVDAILMDLNMPGMSGLQATKAIRSSDAVWSKVPIVALTAHSDDGAMQAAREAGMDGFLVKPVDAGLLYETLMPLVGRSPQPGGVTFQAAASRPSAPDVEGLLNRTRLESYRRLGLLDELLNDYLPEISRLAEVLRRAAAADDLDGSLAALHSLLGISGEAGGLALYQLVRRTYIPMVEQRCWPADSDWLEQLHALAAQTEHALRKYRVASQTDDASNQTPNHVAARPIV